MLGVPGLDPELDRRALAGDEVGIASGPACGLQQQCEQPFGRPVVACEQAAVGVDARDQRDAAKVVALGDHLGADQHIEFTLVHAGELLLQAALGARAVGVQPQHADRFAIRAPGMGQQTDQLFLELFGAASDRRDVEVAATRAGIGHARTVAAVVAAQRAVDLVEHRMRAAVRTVAFPAAGVTGQHRGVAAPVQQQHALLAAGGALGDRFQQRRRQHALLGLVVHVDQPQPGQRAATDALRHLELEVAADLRCAPALERGRGRAQQHAAVRGRSALAFALGPVDREVACRVARAFLALVARVVFLVDHDQAQLRQAGENRHPGAEHDARPALVCRQPVVESLRRRQPAVQRDHAPAREAFREAGLELRRQVDLGHHDQGLRLRVLLEQLLHRAQIDLGLAAAGGAEQQRRPVCGLEALQRDGLFRAEFGPRRGVAHGQGFWHQWFGVCCLVDLPTRGLRAAGRLGQTLELARELLDLQIAQLRRQRGQRHFAQAALVIACGKARQSAPGGVEWRYRIEYLQHRARLSGLQSFQAQSRRFPDQAQQLALAQWHPHQGAGLQRAVMHIGQRRAQAAVGGCGHDHRQRGQRQVQVASISHSSEPEIGCPFALVAVPDFCG